jgi:hypothetical protein
MKKILLFLVMLTSFSTSMNAQEVFNSIKSKASEVVNDPLANPIVKKISQFKLDALDYLVIKMKEQMPDSTVTFLDKEALAMNNFITLYTQSILDNRSQPGAYQVKIIKLFMDASYSNPLFKDSDTELVLVYYNNGESLTRFSLDTDWRRAYIAAATELKKIK